MLAAGYIIIGFRFFNLNDFRFAHSPLRAVGKSIRLGKRRKSKHHQHDGQQTQKRLSHVVPPYFSKKYTATNAPRMIRYQPNAVKLCCLM